MQNFASRSALLASVLFMCAGSAFAMQPASAAPAALAPAPANATDPRDLVRDFVHYVRIARYDLAAAMGDELVRQNLSGPDFVAAVEKSGDLSRFNDAVARAMKVPELEITAGKLQRAYQGGKISMARDPEQIKQAIAMLTGPVRGRIMARERLIPAGEYAMPQLLTALLDGSNPALQAEVQSVMRDMGRQAVMPMGTALNYLPPEQQEIVANAMGSLGRRTAVPFLADVEAKSSINAVKIACARAITKLGGKGNAKNSSDLYYQLAEAYFAENSDLTPFESDDFQILWGYTPAAGLTMQPIRTAVFHEAMAMRMAEQSLQLDPSRQDAVVTWVASNFARQIDTPKDYENPAYGSDKREAMYYAVAAGPVVSQRVLGRALTNSDTPLARLALSAVEKTAGGNSLVMTEGNRSPLVDALGYPNRRVQYEAALALAQSAPTTKFVGADRVVPTLSGAVRDSGVRYSVVIADGTESYQQVRKVLEKSGYVVLPMGKQLSDIAGPLSETPGVDLVIGAGLSNPKTVALVEEVRADGKLGAAPFLGLTSSDVYNELRTRFENDASTSIRPAAMGDEMVSRSIDELVQRSTGGSITAEEAKGYQARALNALRDLAVSNNTVFEAADAVSPLVTVLGGGTASKIEVAEILSRINSSKAQVAIMDAALNASASEQAAMIEKVTASVKRFGAQLEPRQVVRAIELATAGDTHAAALVGAMGIQTKDLVKLIMGVRNDAK